MATFGFIGTGNMGGALARAARKRLSGGEILLANRSAAKAEALAQELDCRAVDNAAVAAGADYIFLGVKPYMVAGLMEKIGPVLAARKDRFVLVSMAAALTIPDLRERGCGDWPLIRIMPNTPSAIGEGVIFYTCDGVTAEEEAAFLENMAGAGRLLPLDDHLMDAGSAVAGCGPAFVDLFIEAKADGGVACGLPRAAAMEFAMRTAASHGSAAREMSGPTRRTTSTSTASWHPATPSLWVERLMRTALVLCPKRRKSDSWWPPGHLGRRRAGLSFSPPMWWRKFWR